MGSGNVGATNVLRVSSPTTAMTVLALDATKGSLAVWLAETVSRHGGVAVVAGLAAVAAQAPASTAGGAPNHAVSGGKAAIAPSEPSDT